MSFALNGQIGKNKNKNKGRAQSNSCLMQTGKEMTLSDGMRCRTRSGEAKALGGCLLGHFRSFILFFWVAFLLLGLFFYT